ncbi:MAG: hypothetical protein U0794_19500 [Isosphaeraceae bacterium]
MAMSRTFRIFLGLALVAFLAIGLIWWLASRTSSGGNEPTLLDRLSGNTYTVEHTDYTPPSPPPSPLDALLVNDDLTDKHPEWDPDRVDRRPLDGWQVNASAAVIALDIPLIKPDQNPEMGVLRGSYAQAVAAAKGNVLPSLNLVDGKAKQFDDGLYAALDQAYYQGHGERLKSLLGLFKTLQERVAKDTPAADYLAAGLSLAESADPPTGALSGRARTMLGNFLRQPPLSKPIGVYTWNKTLGGCFRVLRFFAQPILETAIVTEIARVMKADPALLAEYQKMLSFYAKLTNPLVGNSPADFLDSPPPPAARVSLLPPSTSRETELFNHLFPGGVPPDADLMRALVEAVRSGKVDLTPRPGSGWYEQQVYALETLLLPGRGEEKDKLMLSKTYKKRMMEAFQALVTKRRETHARQLDMAGAPTAAAPRLADVSPRLRVEPCPSYFVRTARSYAFLETFLTAAVGPETLESLHGLRDGGERTPTLLAELRAMRDLFYGLHLLSAEDLGMKPAIRPDEPVDRPACEKAASAWLAAWKTDPDLAIDTRVAVPVYFDRIRNVTKVWVTLGVRLSPLDALYAAPPRVRPVPKAGETAAEWKLVEGHQLESASFVIPVDTFAEVEIPGGRVYDRNELRAICDKAQTREAIIEALTHP